MRKQRLLVIIGLVAAIAALFGGFNPGWAVPPVTGPGLTPDYFETPNWAFSPKLAKFVDQLPALWDPKGLGVQPAKCIPLAVPDTLTYPGSDYYEIELREYSEVMHSSMPATKLRGYVQTNLGTNAGGTANTVVPAAIRYLGPVIVATKDRPVRIKFTNALPADSKLFVPVDTTIMGSGAFSIDYDPETLASVPLNSGTFSENRATLHLHGGRTPWISDGTPHQWVTPATETTTYPKGVSVTYVPDMWFDGTTGATIPACAGQTTCATAGATNNPGAGSQTFYYTNQQSARLMFYHDHAWGITRLNVYAGEAAGYVITDAAETALVSGGLIPGAADTVPLIIQDKTFVDDNATIGIVKTDPTWAWGSNPVTGIGPMAPVKGDLWWPHVYMPAQNPFNPDLSGINAMGRWHYGPWFWPPTPLCGSSAQAVPPYCVSTATVPNPYYDPNCDANATGLVFCQPPEIPGTPSPSWGAEAFLDTMVVNGAAYPTVTVQPRKYRLRVLNASHDRFINLQMYQAVSKVGYTNPTIAPYNFTGTGPTDLTEVAMVPASTHPVCTALVTTNCVCDPATAPIGTPTGCFPPLWPADGREGGVPDPVTRGPAMIQIGTEGGFLPAPYLLTNQPVKWNVDPTMFNVGNVLPQPEGGGTLILGPAERGDVIVDFTNFSGKTLILYNDAPTAYPALDPHYDYYTGAPDRTDIGGTTAILPGVGPNIRTVMQIIVDVGGSSTAPVDDYNATTLTNLQNAFKATAGAPTAFAVSQPEIIVGQKAYGTAGDSAYNTTFPATWPNWGLSRIGDNAISFKQVNGTIVSNFPMNPKAIHDEMGGTFDDFGRMSAKLGLEVPFSNAAISTFALQNFVDPSTEILGQGDVQIWKITHNGVDTHPIHFHLFDVQLINRVGWDGFIRLPDPNELGWKDTIRMSPLEDTIVALRAVRPVAPFALPNSVRPLNPAIPLGSTDGFSQIDPLTGAPKAVPTTNEITNFGWEYVWHCHILSHEENDMMRPIIFKTSDVVSPSPAVAVASGPAVAWNSTLNQFQIAIRGTDNGIYVSTARADGTFSNVWVKLSGSTSDTPAIAWNPTSNKVHIAVKGLATNNLFVANFNADGSGMSSYTQIAGAPTLSGPAVAWNTLTNRLQIAVRSTNNSIRVGSVRANGTNFSGWSTLGSTTSVAPGIAFNANTGRIQLVTKGNTNSNIYVGNANASGGNFSGWTQVTGATSVSPSIAWNTTTGKIQLAVKGNASTNVFSANLNADGTGFSGWTQVPSGVSTVSPALAIANTFGTQNVFTRNGSGNLAEYTTVY
jgi:FtsP/CotA-like multicopper oxidase with cupredoxin domain